MASIPVAQAREDVAALFLSYLGRAPEFQAMNYYVGLYNQLLAEQGDAAAGAANAFKALSAQIYVDAGTVGEIPTGPSVTDAEYVNWIYQNVLGRAADEGGLAYWVEQLGTGAVDRAELVGIVIAAALTDDRDGAYLANRTEVALEFAKFENSNPQILGSLKFNAKQVLEGVNEDPASVVAAQDKLYGTTNGGETFTLTPGVDNLTGTAGNDVFNALPVNPVTGAAANTLNAFDTIDGGAGRDTLNIYTDGTHNVTQQGTVRNVEVINIHNLESGTAFGSSAVDASKFVGAEEVWQRGQAVTVTNLSATTVAGFADLTAMDLYATSAAGVAKATFALDNVTANNGNLSLNATGAALKDVVVLGAVNADAEGEDADVTISIEHSNAQSKNVTVTLATEVDATVVLTGAGIVALDASASTGDIEYTVAGNVTSVIGGAGDDVFIFGADRLMTLRDNVDGGEGMNTVVTAQSGQFTTQDYDTLDRLQNIDTLAFVGTNVWVNAAELTAFDTLAFGGAGFVAVENLAADQGIVVFDNVEYGDESSTPLALILGNAAADVAITLDAEFSLGEGFSFPRLLITDDQWTEVSSSLPGTFFPIGEEEDGMLDDINELVGEQGETGGTLTLDGVGSMIYGNAGGKFTTIDVSELDGFFALYAMSDEVAETVKLGEDTIALIVVDVRGGSSTLGLTDVIEGFTAFDLESMEVEAFPDAATLLFGLGEITEIELAADVTDLAALTAAAEAYAAQELGDNDVILFHQGGDTYLYANISETGKYDDGDFLIKIVGTFSSEDFYNPISDNMG